MKLSKEEHDGFTEATEALDDHFADDSKKVEEWTKFDPNDPKTFPPDGQDVIFINGEYFTIGFVFRGSVYCDKGFTPAYWRPLPKPPQTEGK